MPSTRLRQTVAMLTAAAVLASMTVATLAAPASAAKPKCAGKTATIVGTDKADLIIGTPKRDVIVAKGGADRIFGRGGNDLICAGAGNDRVVGNAGIDKLIAGRGVDRLFGGSGPDRLFGGPGPDTIAGQPGNDVIDGGVGVDTCYQGLGTGPVVRCELPVAPVAPVAPTGPTLIPIGADVLAIAYSDIDGLDGYSSGDQLISKLIDADGNGVDEDDRIEMGRFPIRFESDVIPHDFAYLGISSHTVTGVPVAPTATSVWVDSGEGSHNWVAFSKGEFYFEENSDAFAYIGDRFDVGVANRIEVEFLGPSGPAVGALRTTSEDDSDEDFIDVEIFGP